MKLRSLYLTALFTLLTLAGCQSKKEKLSASILQLENSDSSSTPKGFDQLAELYFEYAKSFPEDSLCESYLYKGFMFKYITSHWEDALNYASLYKSRYPASENFYRINLKLADVYRSGKKNLDSAANYYVMAAGKVEFSNEENRNAANTLIQWVDAHPGSAQNPSRIFTAAKLSQLCTDYEPAIERYLRLVKEYPADEKCPDALMAAAFISWDNLKNTQKAGEYYRLLAEKYPQSPLAKEAKTILSENLLNMTELEMAEYLSKKNQSAQPQ